MSNRIILLLYLSIIFIAFKINFTIQKVLSKLYTGGGYMKSVITYIHTHCGYNMYVSVLCVAD